MRTLIALTAGLLFVACSRSEVQVEYPEGGPPLNQFFSMKVFVNPSEADSIQVDADMPAHGHGMIVKPVVTQEEPGVWRVDGMKYHMPGAWELYVDLLKSDSSERVVVPVFLEPY
ncbi:MAG: FixH family protein [Planctomycetota bacterium]|jgi:hypothetical protein|nr:FixH family protein [Planctomycetota bacterium]MDP6941622.1 FixH family protein [Planctomycetota bacterium]